MVATRTHSDHFEAIKILSFEMSANKHNNITMMIINSKDQTSGHPTLRDFATHKKLPNNKKV